MKDIIVISNFCSNITKKSNGRFQYICEELIKEGNEVELIISDYNHDRKNRDLNIEKGIKFKVTILHEKGYKKNVSFQRLMSHHSWGREVKKYLMLRKKPDVIYCAVPPLIGALEAARHCKKNGIRFVIDIQDLWPEAFKLVLNIPVVSEIIFSPLGAIANGIYKRADAICGVSETYVMQAVKRNRKVEEGTVVFLGTNLATFDKNVINNKVNKNSNVLWIGYCGTLGACYDLTVIIDALKILSDRGVPVPILIVMGDGERRKEFEEHASSLKIPSVFTGILPYDQMCGRLSACDIVVNPIMHNAAQSIINKHADYAAAGLPVINTQENKEYRDLIDRYYMGFNCNNGDAKNVAECIERLVNDKNLRKQMGKNARRCAEELFDRGRTYSDLISVIIE